MLSVHPFLEPVQPILQPVEPGIDPVDSLIGVASQVGDVAFGGHLVDSVLGKMGHQGSCMLGTKHVLQPRIQGVAGRLNG